MTTNEKVAELRARLERAREVERAAQKECYRIQIELERAEGDEFSARWTQFLLDGDNAAAHACLVEHVARRVVDGRATVEDFGKGDRATIAAEVERLKAGNGS